jgi:protein involved in polysaccharide export with SLBB domain
MKMNTLRWLFSLLLVLVCGLDAGAVELAPPRDGYRIGANDVIRIQVFGEDDLTVESKVSGEGKLNYPLLGMLQVEGRTTEELQQELTVRLAAGYVRLPKVSVSIVRHRNFYVSGEVKTPGGFPYEEGLTVQKALSIAGGFTEKAEKQGLKVTRLTEGRVETLTIGPDEVIQPNDILMVATQNHKFYVSGEVKNPGAYAYGEGLSVQKAIAMAGGLTEKAEKGILKATRIINGREELLSVKLETPVLPDDVILVAEAQRLYVTGEVRTPGRYFYEPGMTVQRALSLAGGFTEKSDKTGIKVRRPNGKGMDTILVEVDALVMPDDLIVVTQSKKFYVNGEVKRPGDYAYETGLTVHKAITIAGGFTDKAVTKRAKVLRVINGEERTIEVPLDGPVLPEDIIMVSQRFF